MPQNMSMDVTAWLAGPPGLRGEAELLTVLLDDLLRLLRPYGIRSVWTSEPRIYRTGSRGRALLAEALADGRVEGLVLDNRPVVAEAGSANAHLRLGPSSEPDLAFLMTIVVRPALMNSPAQIAAQLTGFLLRWLGPLRAAAAFISYSWIQDGRRVGDQPLRTAYEEEHGLPTLISWSALRRYARGAFWGTGLGPDLCAQLGGQVRVLREAPVALARPVDKGVWLQLSDSPPAEPAALAHLAAFLAPLLTWTREDVLAVESEAHGEEAIAKLIRSTSVKATAFLPPAPTPETADASPAPLSSASQAVPIRGLRDLEPETGLNVYLAAPPTPAQRATMETAMEAWYREGFNGHFGGTGFHDLTGPTVDGRVMRWHADFGSADARHAIRSLARRLAELPGATVERLVVGTEHAG